MPSPEPVYFKVFGLQRSGTNLMQALLLKNFHVGYLQEHDTGWKHGPLRIPQGTWNGRPVRFVLCVKDPYSWAVSCYRFFRRYAGADPTIAPQFQADPSTSFEEFLLTPSYGFTTPIHRWNQMHRLWLATLPQDRTLVVRQEDQLTDQIPVLQKAQATLSLPRRNQRLEPIDRRVDMDLAFGGAMNRDYYLDRRYMEAYTPCLLDRVNGTLDRQLMHRFEYEPEGRTIERRRIGPLLLYMRPCTSDAADVWHVLTDPYRLGELRRSHEAVGTIVDLSAGIGAFAAFAKHLWPQARVSACESCPHKRRLLRINSRDLPGVTTYPEQTAAQTLPALLAELGEIHLLRTDSPQTTADLFQHWAEADVLRRVHRIDGRAPPGPDAEPLLTRLAGTHRVRSWITPAGCFFAAERRNPSA